MMFLLTFSIVWLDWYKVISDNRQIVAINAELFDRLGASIDQTQAVGSTRRQLENAVSSITCAWCAIAGRLLSAIVRVSSIYQVVIR